MTHDAQRSSTHPTPPEQSAPSDPERPVEAPEKLFSPTYRAATTTFAAVMFLTGLAALAVIPTLPTAAEALDGVRLFPLVAGCFVAASLFGGVLGGHWADRSGAHRPLAAGMALAVVTLVVSGVSTSIWHLAAGRFLDGVAAGMVAVAVNTAIGQSYPPALRPRALALMSTCWIVPSLIGPPLAGVVAELWSWRTVFLGLAVLTLIPALAVVAVLRGVSWSTAPTAEAVEATRPPLLLAATVSVGAALAQYGVSGWDAWHLLFAGGGLVLLVAFTPRLLPPGTFRAARRLPVTVLLRGLGSGVFFTLEALVPLMLVTDRDAPPLMIGLAFTSAALAWAAASWVQGHLLVGWPRHRLVSVGAVVLALAVVVAAVGTVPSLPPVLAASAMPVAALGMGLVAPSLTVLSLAHSPAARQGYASGAMQTSQNLGQISVLGIGSAALNICLAVGTDRSAGYATAFVLLLIPCLLAVLLSARTRHP
ncbi:MFS transporter [Streptomyces sp. NPDC127068]|uniref:MFS transporter n=1 Tax=Streptomyces sp. NPDC127068 TaxID=3347127 RepID=UPI0036594DD1